MSKKTIKKSELEELVRTEVKKVLSERDVDLNDYPKFVQETAYLMNRDIVNIEEIEPGKYHMEFSGTMESGIGISKFGQRGIRIRSIGYYDGPGIIWMIVTD